MSEGSYIASSFLSRSLLTTLQLLEGFPETLNLQLSHFLAQKSSMALHCSLKEIQTLYLILEVLQKQDPAQLPSLTSHCSPLGSLWSSQRVVLSAPGVPSMFSYPGSSHILLHPRPHSLHPVFRILLSFQSPSHIPPPQEAFHRSLPLKVPSTDGTQPAVLHLVLLQTHRAERVWALQLRKVCVQIRVI